MPQDGSISKTAAASLRVDIVVGSWGSPFRFSMMGGSNLISCIAVLTFPCRSAWIVGRRRTRQARLWAFPFWASSSRDCSSVHGSPWRILFLLTVARSELSPQTGDGVKRRTSSSFLLGACRGGRHCCRLRLWLRSGRLISRWKRRLSRIGRRGIHRTRWHRWNRRLIFLCGRGSAASQHKANNQSGTHSDPHFLLPAEFRYVLRDASPALTSSMFIAGVTSIAACKFAQNARARHCIGGINKRNSNLRSGLKTRETNGRVT